MIIGDRHNTSYSRAARACTHVQHARPRGAARKLLDFAMLYHNILEYSVL